MKKFFTILLSLIAFGVIAAEPVKQASAAAIDKLLAYSGKKMVEQAFTTVLDGGAKERSQYGGTVSFHNVYHYGRQEAYKNLFGGSEGAADWGNYYELRTIVVARVKEYIHADDNLIVAYKANRQGFIDRLAKLSPEEKVGVQNKIAEAIKIFTAMLKPEIQNNFMIFRKEGMKNPLMVEDMLERNEPSEKIIHAIKSGAMDQGDTRWMLEKTFLESFGFEKPVDRDLAKFAGRRFAEGKNGLVKKYLAMFALMAEDAK